MLRSMEDIDRSKETARYARIDDDLKKTILRLHPLEMLSRFFFLHFQLERGQRRQPVQKTTCPILQTFANRTGQILDERA